jgi:4,5-dihydroxyphthalate decarboxylase
MLSLTCAISEYDHVRDLASGRVRAEGIELSILIMPVEEVFFRALRFREFDICEMSMGRYVSLVSRGDCPFVAIPVFPSRMFGHSSLYVRRNGAVREPGDLRGKRIGIPEWAQTAGIYTRGMLADHFGVALAEVEWVQAGIHEIGREEEVVVHPPAGVTLTRVVDRTLNDMLLSGEIDAMLSAHPPHCFESGDQRVQRLFEDFMSVEHRYWQDTGVFPIMHTILLSRELYEKYRWIAMNLLEAFTAAKERTIARARDVTAARFPVPWLFEYVRRTVETFGEDYWPYGIEANRTTLLTFLKYAYQQGITKDQLAPDDLFAPEVRSRFKV